MIIIIFSSLWYLTGKRYKESLMYSCTCAPRQGQICHKASHHRGYAVASTRVTACKLLMTMSSEPSVISSAHRSYDVWLQLWPKVQASPTAKFTVRLSDQPAVCEKTSCDSHIMPKGWLQRFEKACELHVVRACGSKAASVSSHR